MKSLWENNCIQFSRLLCEINATQENLNFEILSESMDLDVKELYSIFERANTVWEKTKRGVINENNLCNKCT